MRMPFWELPLHKDHRPNPDQMGSAAFVELLHLHRHGVGNLFAGVVQHPFPDEFGHQEALAGIGLLIQGVEGRRRRQEFDDLGHQLRQTVPHQGAQGDDGRPRGTARGRR